MQRRLKPDSRPSRRAAPEAARDRDRSLIVFSTLIVGGYSVLAFSQRELGEPDREEIPKSVRASPGGYRSYHFWHSGYHGGK